MVVTPSHLSTVEARLLALIDDAPDHSIYAGTLPKAYQNRYGSPLEYQALGFKQLRKLIQSLHSVSVVVTEDNSCIVTRAKSATSRKKRVKQTEQRTKQDEQKRIHSLFADNDYQNIMLSQLQSMYKKKYQQDVDYKEFGFSKFKAFVGSLSQVEVKQLSNRTAGKGAGSKRSQPYACFVGKQKGAQKRKTPTPVAMEEEDPSNEDDCLPQRKRVRRDGPATACSQPPLTRVTVITSASQVDQYRDMVPFASSRNKLAESVKGGDVVTVECMGTMLCVSDARRETLKPAECYMLDTAALGPLAVATMLSPVLACSKTKTVVFNLYRPDMAQLVRMDYIKDYMLAGLCDVQLAVELKFGNHGVPLSMSSMLSQLGLVDERPDGAKRETDAEHTSWSDEMLHRAAARVALIHSAYDRLCTLLSSDEWRVVQRASGERARHAAAHGGVRRVCFDRANSFALSSPELLTEVRPHDIVPCKPLQSSNEVASVLELLPPNLSNMLEKYSADLNEISLDEGRTPVAWVGQERILLSNVTVQRADLIAIADKVGTFGPENRAGIPGHLHRVSAIRTLDSTIVGLTMRVGRHVFGNADMIADLLFAQPSNRSILFLGEPGSGKTSIVREVARMLAEKVNVCIVDTSNEIAGDTNVPHPCVGHARRLMVPSLDKQGAVMVECVQNHTPAVIVIDEIGRSNEVEAARTCKNRGVRLIASAHGDLRNLIRNPQLRGLLGGVQQVTLGDAQARLEATNRRSGGNGSIQKTKAERAGAPTFDVIIELTKGKLHEWRVVINSAEAVDDVLAGMKYQVQYRRRNPGTGAIELISGKA